MRIYFQNASIPTRAVDRLKYRLSLKESQARQVTSEVFGYKDWTELHSELGSKAASALDEACDSATLTGRRDYQASQLVASSVDLHGESADDLVRWWQPSAANPQKEGGGPTETPFAGSKEDLSFQAALSTLAHAAHLPVGHFEQALTTGIRRTENESSLRLAESIADELLSGNRNREPEVARHLLEALASRGLPRSILNLAMSLDLGDGGPKDEKRAAALLEQLAKSASTPDDLKRIAESRLGA
jgi:TPR repeat protein